MKPVELMNLDMDLPMGVFNHDSNLLFAQDDELENEAAVELLTLNLMKQSSDIVKDHVMMQNLSEKKHKHKKSKKS